MYVNRIVNYIAMYYVEMGGADAIVFTAGVGENSISTRRQIVDKLGALGIKLDEEANNVRGEERKLLLMILKFLFILFLLMKSL